MIMVTGGAGFIGSNLQAALARRGEQTVIVDRLGDQDKWRNLAKHPPDGIVHPDALDGYLAVTRKPEAIVHLGAISETTARDGDLVWATNVELPLRLWRWCATRGVRFIYASSAATYGDGSAGFDDSGSIAALSRLRPMNLYGWTKHVFDLRVARMIEAGEPCPPQWAGLKFFNVYGPNEYHKGPMISVVKVKHDEIAAGGPVRLFRSDRPGLADGEQRRDFIWVGDVVEVMLWLLDSPRVNGLFNVGTGQARSYLDLARVGMPCGGRGAPHRIHRHAREAARPVPVFHRGPGSRSCAQAGYDRPFTPLEEGVRRYVQDFLTQPDRYL